MKNPLTIEQIWKHLESGNAVKWGNDNYELHGISVEPGNPDTVKYQKAHHTYKNGMVLRCTCIANYFGSLLDKTELSSCYLSEEPRILKDERE